MDRQPNPSIQESSVDQEKKPDSTVKSGIQYTRRFAWPLAVIVGQAFLLVISFAFFAAVRSRGQIPLQWALAYEIQLHPQSKTYVVTFISNCLSVFSSYLFSQAVRHAILVYLTGPMSIANLGFGISISKRNLIFERGEIRWVLVGAVFFLATLGQTPSWNSLLTPTTIGISTPLRGSEIDLTSNALSDQFWDLWNGSSSGIQFYLESALSSVIGPSGAASADSQIGYISVLDFAGWVHVGDTGGISPIIFNPDSDINGLVTSNTKPLPPPGSDFNISMIQQGLNAIVSCQYQQLNANTDPALTRSQSNPINIVVGDQTVSHTVVGIATVCPNGPRVHTETLTSTNDTLLAISCGIIDDAGTTTYTVIIDAQGIYSYPNGDSVVCRVTPQTQNFNVTYSEEFIYKNLDSEPLDPDIKPAPPLVAFAAIHGLDQAFFYGQSGTTRNVIGDSMFLIYGDQSQDNALPYPALWEAYIRGVIAFVGTAVKYDLALDNGPLGGNPPSSLTREITGNALTTTIGWGYREGASNYAMLIPTTFVALASIMIVLFAEYKNGFGGIPTEHASFDPSNSLHLMAAASAGGMQKTFKGLAKKNIKEGSAKKLKLGKVGSEDGEGFEMV